MTTTEAKSKQWSPEWPTEPGYYWVYGDVYGCGIDRQTNQPFRKLEMAEVRRIGNGGMMHIVSGHFAFKKEAGDLVLWRPMEVPEIPNE